MILMLGKASSLKVPNLGWVTWVIWCFTKKLHLRRAWCMSAHVVMKKLPITHCIVPKSLLNNPNGFCGGMFKLKAKFDADSLFYSLSHFECDGHTEHMLTQCHLPSPLTSTVKLSLFTHVPYSPLPLAAGLHRCHANHSCYINNRWTFSSHWQIYV